MSGQWDPDAEKPRALIGNNVCLACKPPSGVPYWTCFCGTDEAWKQAEAERLAKAKEARRDR